MELFSAAEYDTAIKNFMSVAAKAQVTSPSLCIHTTSAMIDPMITMYVNHLVRYQGDVESGIVSLEPTPDIVDRKPQ